MFGSWDNRKGSKKEGEGTIPTKSLSHLWPLERWQTPNTLNCAGGRTLSALWSRPHTDATVPSSGRCLLETVIQSFSSSGEGTEIKGVYRFSAILRPYTAWSYLPLNKRRKGRKGGRMERMNEWMDLCSWDLYFCAPVAHQCGMVIKTSMKLSSGPEYSREYLNFHPEFHPMCWKITYIL